MEDHIHKFMELQRYFNYIRDERLKIHSFIGGFPTNYKDIIKFADSQTLEATIRMTLHCYEKSMGKTKV